MFILLFATSLLVLLPLLVEEVQCKNDEEDGRLVYICQTDAGCQSAGFCIWDSPLTGVYGDGEGYVAGRCGYRNPLWLCTSEKRESDLPGFSYNVTCPPNNNRAKFPCLRYVCCSVSRRCFGESCANPAECDVDSGLCRGAYTKQYANPYLVTNAVAVSSEVESPQEEVEYVDIEDDLLACTSNEQCDTEPPMNEMCVNGRCRITICECKTKVCHLKPSEVAGCYNATCNADNQCYAIPCVANTVTIPGYVLPLIVIILCFVQFLILILYRGLCQRKK
jgi:hypothetical protein